MTPPAADDDKTAIPPRGATQQRGGAGGGYEPTHFAPTAPVQRTEMVAPPPQAKSSDLGNVLPVGTRVREFEITGLLGEGGFGIVYLAYDSSVQREVALKEYMPTSLAARTEAGIQVKSERYRETFDAGMKSFVNEARLLAQFDHPSLVRVYQFWEGNGTAYMVMPFYKGKNLRDTLREMIASTGQPPDEAWLRTLLLPLTEALRVIHAENCYHRDIAPDNVMMLAGSQRPLLLDFGAARRVIGDMTQALTVILKPGYAPIEQYAEAPGMRQGPWTDVYALAAVVYFAITGKTPPVSVGRMLNDSYQPLAQAAAGRYSAQFLEAVDRALVVRAEERTPSIEAFQQDLGLLGGQPGGSGLTTLLPTQAADERTRIAPVTQRPNAAAPAAQTLMPQTQRPAQTVRQAPPPDPVTLAADPDERTRMAPRRPAAPAPAAAQARSRRGLVLGLSGVGVLALSAGGYVLMRPKPTPPPTTPPERSAATTAPPTSPPAPPPAPPPPPVAAFSAVREFDKAVLAQSAGFTIAASTPKATLRLGEQFRFSVQSERAGHLYVLGVGPDGMLAQLVPNRRSGPVRLRAGQAWQFPGRDGFALDASEPIGPTQFLFLVSAEPRSFEAMKPRDEGDIRVFAGGEAATAAVAAHAGPGSVLAGRASCAAGAAACDASYGAASVKVEVVR